jgi:hypothetical protein
MSTAILLINMGIMLETTHSSVLAKCPEARGYLELVIIHSFGGQVGWEGEDRKVRLLSNKFEPQLG